VQLMNSWYKHSVCMKGLFGLTSFGRMWAPLVYALYRAVWVRVSQELMSSHKLFVISSPNKLMKFLSLWP